MDAPTTTSADNGTSGGGGGWFTPRKNPTTTRDSDARTPDGDARTAEGRRPAAIRPVGRPGAAPEAPADDPSAPPTATPGRPSNSGPDQRRESPDVMPTPAAAAARHAPSPTAVPSLATASSPGPVPTALTPAPFASTMAPPPAAAEQRVPEQRHAPVSLSGEAAIAPAETGSPDALLIRRAMAEVAPVSDKVTSYFYALLFVRYPDLRSLFPAAMDTQRDRLLRALLTAAEHIDNKDVLVDYLQNLGRGHRKYGTRAEHYPAVGECLIGALSKYAAGVWSAEMEAAWVRAYTTISQVMIDAAAADELRAPAWWYAEIVTHDLRTPDVAVVTVRPDQPYPFLAGQYTSLETPWWPRIWRHYSFASAPRSDGLLSFHVKAVPAGWVSNALVHRARPGDIIRLGPPAGSMTVDHTTDSGLLCLGGGTGIAPIKALVEDVAEHGDRRSVEVFYGARTDHDLYDIDTMLRLQQTHPWLSVRAIIDQQAHQQLPDAIRAYGPWNEFDAYLSGPPGMIRSGVDALRDSGIPSDRIRHDSVEELVAAGN
ncbi:flavohemoprotein [Streptomyces sp. D2-8]|uniref:globin domain-containing protein n=1 Tax=Streptomyces sp. D2-8 TaxID=2707767 RepID=UPI0020BF034D|nr:globin domain-containing protein [Streptomyces sp. D2-8]MCK8433814.1 flavohemoprotein [Streptomyces sp. D2-8]